jgi:hypothetical protein
MLPYLSSDGSALGDVVLAPTVVQTPSIKQLSAN